MSDTIDQSAVSTAAKRHSSSRRHPFLVWLAVVWLGVMIVAGIGADILSPHDYRDLDLRNRLLPPLFFGGQLSHPLGTDQLGHDVFSRLLHSIRMSFLVALIGTVIGAALGTILGFIAAHRRGIADDVITMFVDFQAAMPFTIIALTVLAFFGNDLMLFIAVMGIYGWERYARLARGLALSARKQGYALALDTLGAGPWRIYSRHILPNIGSVLIVNMTINFPETILAESALSFLGLGIQPPLTSLGNMLGYGRDYLTTAWWIVVFPGLTIVFSVLAMSLLGDWLRDRLDPRISAN
ncbi:ABC transporter permease [Algihabitans albus]|uniref:ABC transporter permease n=1 Tax=Algihabitans albus TaxID=2164067 RepID=UPI0035CF9893